MAYTEVLSPLLDKIAAENNYVDPEIIIKEVSSGGANYTSKLFTVIIREDNKEDLHLFSKVATDAAQFREALPPRIYEIEKFAYLELSKTYLSLEEENGVPSEHRLLFSKCYGVDPRLYQETLVLEDLVAQGYAPHDRLTSIDWQYAAAAVTDLAKLHALSFAYKQKNPVEFKNTLDLLKIEWKEGSLDAMMQSSINTALENVKAENKEVLRQFLDKNKGYFMERLWAPVRCEVIIHADYRGDNLLHRVREVN